MGAVQAPTKAMGPFRIEMRRESFYLQRRVGDADEVRDAGPADHLRIEAAELPAFRAALAQAQQHPHVAEARWDAERSWRGAEGIRAYTAEEIAAADAPWEIRRAGSAITVAGPLWSPRRYPSGSFFAEVEYARLAELVAALDALETGAGTGKEG